jgi:hypothetical protein
MSLAENDEWLESARENFEEALDVEDFALCRAIIADCFTEGFDAAARALQRELDNAQN